MYISNKTFQFKKEPCRFRSKEDRDTFCITTSFHASPMIASTPRIINTNLRLSESSDLQSINTDVLSSQDLTDGIVIAFILAFLFTFLQGWSPSSFNVKLWPEDNRDSSNTPSDTIETKNASSVVFDGDKWKDVSKPENYVLYTSKLRNKQRQQEQIRKSSSTKNTTLRKENKLVFFALLLLFVPLFSAEFFFALSRQFLCGNFVTEVSDSMWLTDSERALSSLNDISPWARELCSPHR